MYMQVLQDISFGQELAHVVIQLRYVNPNKYWGWNDLNEKTRKMFNRTWDITITQIKRADAGNPLSFITQSKMLYYI